MRIQNITLTNFRVIEGTIVFENRSLPGLPLLIEGQNAVGKTTIFDALTLLLFRTVERKGKINTGFQFDTLINHNAQEMSISADVEGLFRIDPLLPPQNCVLRFTCHQNKTPKNKHPASKLKYHIQNMSTGENIDEAKVFSEHSGSILQEASEGFTKSNTFNTLLELDYNTFRSSIFIAQDGFYRFFESKQAREEIIQLLLRIGFDKEEKKILDEVQKSQKTQNEMEKIRTDLNLQDDFDSWKKEVDRIQIDIQECEKKSVQFQSDLQKSNQNVGVYNKTKQQFRSKIATLKNFINKLQDLNRDEKTLLGSNTQAQWDAHTYYPLEVREAYRNWKNRIDHAPAEERKACMNSIWKVVEITKEYTKIEQSLQELNRLTLQLDKIEAELLQYEKEHVALQEQIAELSSIQDTISAEKHRQYLHGIGAYIGEKTKWTTIQALHPALKEESEDNKVQIHQSIVHDFETAIVEKEQTVRRKKDLQDLNAQNTQKKSDILEKKEAWKATKESIHRQHELLSGVFSSPIDRETSIPSILQDIQRQYAFAMLKSSFDILTEYDWDELCRNILSVEEEKKIQMQRKDIAKREDDIGKEWSTQIHPQIIQETINSRSGKLAYCENFKDILSAEQNDISTKCEQEEQNGNEIQTELDILKEKLFTLQHRRKELLSLSAHKKTEDVDVYEFTREWFERLHTVRSDLALYEKYRRYVGLGKHTPSITKRALGLLTSDLVMTANKYLDRFLQGAFTLCPLKENNIFVPGVSIIHQLRGTKTEYSDLSGGQRFLICLALSLALADQLSGGKAQFIHALIIDEGFGSLDEENCQIVVDILKEYSEEYKKDIICIAHTEYLKSRLGNSVEVKKHNNKTRLVYSNTET